MQGAGFTVIDHAAKVAACYKKTHYLEKLRTQLNVCTISSLN